MTDLEKLQDDGDIVELEDGRVLRLRIEPDQGYDPFMDSDCYGTIAAVEGRRNDYGYWDRPDGFDGNAEKLSLPQNCGAVWWQPPADVKRTDPHFAQLRSLVIDLATWGGYVVTLEQLEGEDAYRNPIVVRAASLGGIDSLEDGYLAEIVRELADELS